MKYYIEAFKNCGVFKGRSSRKEYWMFVLFQVVITIIFYMALYVLLSANNEGLSDTIAMIFGIYCLISILPSISISVRRLHDVDKSGWWFLFGIIPVLGLVSLAWYCSKGTLGNNRFGSDPKAIETVES